MSVQSVLALGSNLGNSLEILTGAVQALAENPRIDLEAVSPVAVTAPVGGPEGQGNYLNLVVRIRTDLSPFTLLRFCQDLEAHYHRVREVHWGPRTLDIDVVTYGDLVMDEPELMLPHPRAGQRAFVLDPWARMDPGALLNGVLVSVLAARAEDLSGISEYLDPITPTIQDSSPITSIPEPEEGTS